METSATIVGSGTTFEGKFQEEDFVVATIVWRRSDVEEIMRKNNIPVTDKNLEVFMLSGGPKTLREQCVVLGFEVLDTLMDPTDFYFGKYKLSQGYVLFDKDGNPGDYVDSEGAKKHLEENNGVYKAAYCVIDTETGLCPAEAEDYHFELEDALEEVHRFAGISEAE